MKGSLTRRTRVVLAVVLAVAIAAAPTLALGKPQVKCDKPAMKCGKAGFVYVLSNESANSVLVFTRDAHGQLYSAGSVSTGGSGTGAGLGSQGALALSRNGRWLVAVNAGSNEISLFRVDRSGMPTLVDTASSQGTTPVSVSVAHGLVYVLNQGGTGNIAGFNITASGELSLIPGSIRPLSNLGVGSAPVAEQIGISPWGNLVVVTEKSTNLIDVYGLTDCTASSPTTFASNGAAPYGFEFTRLGKLVVSEAAANALSSYRVSPTSLDVITGSLADGGQAPCWVAISPNNRFAYTADAHSNDISIYRVSPRGALTLVQGAAVTVSTPLDLDLTRNGRYLYVLSAGSHDIEGFRVGPCGTLDDVGSFGTLPASASGLVAR